MKPRLEGDRILTRGRLGFPAKFHVADVESVELIENSTKAEVRLVTADGRKIGTGKLPITDAREFADLVVSSVDPPEAKAKEGLALAEIARRIEAMSERPGIRADRIAMFLLDQALRHQASDLHLEGGERGLSVAMRIDGVIHPAGVMETSAGERALTFLKVEAGVASYRRDVPQEGSMKVGDTDLRLSFMPVRGGEKAVIRIFGEAAGAMELANLGFGPHFLDRFEKMLSRREGMILLTGPSASGKTTTLYSALRQIMGGAGAGHVVSIEDPVECAIPGVTQVQVDEKRDMGFARLLGNVLRQDAEVIMVGEIRSAETARVAIQAALTGHLILSTLHAGRAPEVIVRLLDLDVEPYKAASALAGTVGQRLLRKVCPHCSETYRPNEDLVERYERWLAPDAEFKQGRGCDECYGTGYRGRTAAAELVEAGPEWEELIRSEPSSNKAMEFALAAGMSPLEADACRKASRGITTLEEIERVLG